MNEREQLVQREELPLDVIKDQYRTLNSQVVDIVERLSSVDAKWPTPLLIFAGAGLLVVSLAMRIPGGVFDDVNLTTWEFITLVAASGILVISGLLYSVNRSRNWRYVIMEQQALGMQILHKEIEIAQQAINRKHRRQWGEIIIFHTKIRKSYRH
jgi:hypothetical protein